MSYFQPSSIDRPYMGRDQNKAETQGRKQTKQVGRDWLMLPKAKAAQASEKDKSNDPESSYFPVVSRVRVHYASHPLLSRVVVLP